MGLAFVSFAIASLMIIPIAAHLYFVEEVVKDDNIAFFMSAFIGLSLILSAFILNMLQEAYVPISNGRIKSFDVASVSCFISFFYLATYMLFAILTNYRPENVPFIYDIFNELHKLQAELRFLLLQVIAISVTAVSSILGILYIRNSNSTK